MMNWGLRRKKTNLGKLQTHDGDVQGNHKSSNKCWVIQSDRNEPEVAAGISHVIKGLASPGEESAFYLERYGKLLKDSNRSNIIHLALHYGKLAV